MQTIEFNTVRSRRQRRLLAGAAIALLGFAAAGSAMAQAAAQTTPDRSTGQKAPELDGVTVVGGAEEHRAIDTLGSASVITMNSMDRLASGNTPQIFAATPGLSISGSGEDASSVVNVRGLQDNGRVLVMVDGARQDFSRPTHAGYGSFYLDPDILRSVTVLRGPSAQGGGNIGGVISFETLMPSDILGTDRWAIREKAGWETNGDVWLTSTTAAFKANDQVSGVFNFVARQNHDYTDGNGRTIRYSHQLPRSGLAKIVLKPNAANQITLAYTGYGNHYMASRQAGTNSATLSVDATRALNDTFTARWAYKPQNKLVDFVANAYLTRTDVNQLKTGGSAPLLTTRGYEVKTTGVNAFNSSRFGEGKLKHIVTLGADYANNDAQAEGDASAAVGQQETSGAYVQWEANYAEWLQFIGSLRYNHYSLHGLNRSVTPAVRTTLSDNDVTYRATVGVTPIKGLTPYITRAEGFRPPAIYEVFGIYAGGAATNPSLQLDAEKARSWEGGINFEHRSLISDGDALQAKVNYFDTDIIGYITGRNQLGNTKYYNLQDAKLKGWELEASYNARWGYLGASGSNIDAFREGNPIPNTTAAGAPIPIQGVPISTAPLNRYTLSAGANLLDGRLTFGGMFIHVSETARRTLSFLTYPVNPAYDLVNVYAAFNINQNLTARFNVDNLFDKPWNDPQAQYTPTAPTSLQGRGRTFKFNLVARIGGQ